MAWQDCKKLRDIRPHPSAACTRTSADIYGATEVSVVAAFAAQSAHRSPQSDNEFPTAQSDRRPFTHDERSLRVFHTMSCFMDHVSATQKDIIHRAISKFLFRIKYLSMLLRVYLSLTSCKSFDRLSCRKTL